jgi:fructose-1,6-bisphosphatase I
MAPKIMTIERHILEQQRRYPNATGEFTSLLYDIALAAKMISRETTRAGLADILGAASTSNSYGETQQKLDLFADEIIRSANDRASRFCAMASEEHDDIIEIPPHYGSGNYVLLYDPLDGSSNIDVNVSVGTIFAIHRKVANATHGAEGDVLQPGRKLAAAGYIIYGSSTMLVYSTGQGVHGFTLDPTLGEFLLSHDDIQVPPTAKYYSTNHGREKYWTDGIRRFTEWLQAKDDDREPMSHRYVGSMVADFHRNLLRGGIFYYPGDLQNTEGKLRLMFEAQALAFLAAQAGGYGSDGVGDILDLQPYSLHQRVPLFVGSRDLVEAAERHIQQYDQAWLAAYLPLRTGS